MAINTHDVKKIAHLARLAIDEQAIPEYTHNLSSILRLFAQMDQVDVTNIEPMAHPAQASQRLRKDEVTETNQRDLLQASASQVESGLYLVPKVIE